jgi:hypothetical protein
MRERSQKDYDIIRQSSLKAAAELTVAFHKLDATSEEVADTAIQMAEKFVSWILEPDRPGVDPELGKPVRDWHAKIIKECHMLQKKLNMDITDFDTDPCPYGKWNEGGAEILLDLLRDMSNGNRDPNKSGYQHATGTDQPHTRFREGERDENGHEREDSWAGANFPLSKKQYGFLVSLHKRNKLKYKNDDLNNLTQRQASELIDELKNYGDNGDGDGDPDGSYGGTQLPY